MGHCALWTGPQYGYRAWRTALLPASAPSPLQPCGKPRRVQVRIAAGVLRTRRGWPHRLGAWTRHVHGVHATPGCSGTRNR